ncbi:MAG: hypothetical protein QME74_04900 [Candidatus Edwardsbacteria bacterium]|nr:hypothetical protein [Candidatus Edwardsbacteria bacterium]
MPKYYSLFGAPPPSGVCSGGSRDGEACVPGVEKEQPGDVTPKEGVKEPRGPDASKLCGQSSSCVAINTVSFVRGMYGQCLQRDLSRTLAGSQEHNPCLIWNPAPVLFGKSDVYHYQPTASYLPPQNSGEYYCVAAARPARVFNISAVRDGDLNTHEWFNVLPGSLSRFHYQDDFVSDGDCVGCRGNEPDGGDPEQDIPFIDGAHARGGEMGVWCEAADDSQDDGIGAWDDYTIEDYMAGRWIMTGRDLEKNYLEYFIPLDAAKWTKELRGAEGDAADWEEAMMEPNFAYFAFSPIVNTNTNGTGYIGCGYTPDWVDGVSIDDYDDDDKLKTADKAWHDGFRQNFKSILSRETASMLQNLAGSRLMKIKCLNPDHNPDGRCYYKYWQLDYRAEGQEKFRMLEANQDALASPANYYSSKSAASKAFFSIRAMFEDTNPNENKKDPDEYSPEGKEMAGPFRFVGFWITATVPGAQSERAIYMYLKIASLDTCREVAQVVAPDTREAAAFNDRVWEQGKFSLPLLGYVYATVNPPFGAAMHTRPIGLDPLFQVQGRIPGTKGKLKPPTFISAGPEYWSVPFPPAGYWTLLNNLFARVYRVYRYHGQPITESTGFCSEGPNRMGFCPSEAILGKTKLSDEDAKKLSKEYCGYEGVCDTVGVNQAEFPGVCNALSGVNAGLPCNGDTGNEFTGYHVCHNAPIQFDQSARPNPLYKGCELGLGWSYELSDGEKLYYPCQKDSKGNYKCLNVDKETAKNQGAFRCEKGSVLLEVEWGEWWWGEGPGPLPSNSLKCSEVTKGAWIPEDQWDTSKDCPAMVKPDCKDGNCTDKQKQDPVFIHSGCKDGRCVGFEHSECTQDTDCQFTAQEYWGSYNASKPWGGAEQFSADHKKIFKDFPGAAMTLLPYGARPSQWYWISTYDCLSIFAVCDMGITNPFHQVPKGDLEYIRLYSSYGMDVGFERDEMASVGATWWVPNYSIHSYKNNILFHAYLDPSMPEGAVLGPGKDLGGYNLSGGGFVTLPYDPPFDPNVPKPLKRYPGAYAGAVLRHDDVTEVVNEYDATPKFSVFIPGHCEKSLTYNEEELGTKVTGPGEDKGLVNPKRGLDGTDVYEGTDANITSPSILRSDQYDAPYAEISWFCEDDNNLEDFNDWTVGSEPECGGYGNPNIEEQNITEPDEWLKFTRYFGPAGWKFGYCKGGPLNGSSCLSDKFCTPAWVDEGMKKASETYCKSPATEDQCKVPPGVPCDPKASSLDKDCNLCTHSAGYHPRADLCGGDPTKSQCLTGYNLLDLKKSVDPDEIIALPPTDVTPGLYMPSYLLNTQKKDGHKYGYAAYYQPRPPTVAAPDMTRGCSAAGQCPITQVGAFSLENQSEGLLAYMGGQVVAEIRFYAWAADNQGALKDMWVDWGDGTVQEFHDVKMKNKKPFCGVSKQCENFPGLTCNSDTDCPPAGGRCANVGFCSARSNLTCVNDADCGTGAMKDKCIVRVPFGSSENACEQNYFEFTHAYVCGREAPAILSDCGVTKYCSRDNMRTCTGDGECAPGDKCLSGLAPPGGCFDAAKNACRFTPRVLLKDNWGWCTGECRTKDMGQGQLGIGKFGDERIIYKYGGCYDGSYLYSNIDPSEKMMKTDPYKDIADGNSCDPYKTAGSVARPWIIFKGALQLGIAK